MRSSPHRGNILFLILLAVVLFAALAYAVTSSTRGGGKDISDEKAKLLAANILQHASMIENQINRMVLSGVRKEHLDFRASGSISSGIVNNSNCTSDACRVFGPQGITAMPISREAKHPNSASFNYASAYTNTNGDLTPFIMIHGVTMTGTDAPDIIYYLGYLSPKVCEELNIQLGVLQKGDTTITASHGGSGVGYVYMSGNVDPWPTHLTPNALGSTDSRTWGKQGFCRRDDGSVGAIFYYILHAV